MYLCDNGHAEVCYEVRHCPVCDYEELLSAREKEITKLQQEIDSLMGQLREENKNV